MTTCFKFIRRTASATRFGSSSSSANGFAVVTAQNPQARVQRSPAIMNVAVPWLQHSHLFGHCALSQTVCKRKSEMSALVEKKTGFDGNRTFIQDGFCAWCNAGSIFAQDMEQSYNVKNVAKVKTLRIALNASPMPAPHHHSAPIQQFRFVCSRHSPTMSGMTAILSPQVSNSS